VIKTVFIGNRPRVLNSLLEHPSIELIKAFAINIYDIDLDSYGDVIEITLPHGDKNKIVDFLATANYTLCVSAGCPYKLPMNQLPNDRVFINCHPSALPLGKGIHPLNECFLGDHQTAGVSIHYLTDELDAGDVIEQISFPVTDDLDVSLLYGIMFEIEAELLVKSVNKLIENDFQYSAVPQSGSGTYFSRPREHVTFDASKVTCELFLKNIRAYSSRKLGVTLRTDTSEYTVFSAGKIYNQFVSGRFGSAEPGTVCVATDDVIVVKLIDGLVRLNSWN
jgi:methionyl-tRNA formyltransferase